MMKTTRAPAACYRHRRHDSIPLDQRTKAAGRSAAAWTLLTACLVGLVFGCGPDEESQSGRPPGSSDEEVFAQTITAAFCDGLESCCTSRSNELDRAACESGVQALLAGRAPRSENLRFDSAAAEQCLANVRSALPSCAGIELEPCNRVYVGILASGEACERTEECAPVEGSRVYCQQVCKAARRAAEGESCARTCRSETDCGVLPGEPPSNVLNEVSWGECFTEEGLGCVGGECVRAPREGACLGDSVCDRGFDCENGSCVPLAAIGQPCTSKCVPGAYCSPLYVCEAELADGQPCPEEERCASGNCDFDSCGSDRCSPTCQSPTLGRSHGSAAECEGMVHL